MCPQFAIFNFSEKFYNIKKNCRIRKFGVSVEKLVSQKKICGNKKFSDTVVPLNNWGLMSTMRSGILRCISCGEVQPRPNCHWQVLLGCNPKKSDAPEHNIEKVLFFHSLQREIGFLKAFASRNKILGRFLFQKFWVGGEWKVNFP